MEKSWDTTDTPAPVRNGSTWALPIKQLSAEARERGDRVVAVADHVSSDETPDTTPMTVFIETTGDGITVAPGDGKGWTSIVIRSRCGQWMNLVVYDPEPLIAALESARRHQS